MSAADATAYMERMEKEVRQCLSLISNRNSVTYLELVNAGGALPTRRVGIVTL
jgi:hypothetical protein